MPTNTMTLLVSPKRVVEGRGGSRYVEGVLGFLVSWFHSFLVSWFLGLKVSWCQRFLVSWFRSFKVPKIYQIAISCSLEDIDPISKSFKILLDGSSVFSAPVFSNMFKHISFPNVETCRSGMLFKEFMFSLIFVKYLGVSHDKGKCFWGSGTRPKVPKS